MLLNYLKITFRNFLRYKYFTAINLLGLALGLSCSIFILLWIIDELKFDAFHKNGSRLYRVMENQYYADGVPQSDSSTPGILAEALKNEVPEISHAVQITWEMQELITVGKESHKQTGRYSTSDLLEMFSFPLVSGDAKTALVKPTSIVISEKTAARYFGHEDPMGKIIRVNNQDDFEVTGVLQNVPSNSSLQFDFILPFQAWAKRNEWILQWGNNGPRAFVMLHEGVTQQEVDTKIKDFIEQKLPDNNVELFLQPYTEIYLYSNFKDGKQNGGRIDYVKSFSMVAFVVLLIACINFMNLATAQSMKRAKEISIRKVSGATRKVLIIQFMGEAILHSLTGLAGSLLVVEMLLPMFRQITGKEIFINYSDPTLLLTFVGISLATGIVSGSYPAFLLSSFNIVGVLKGRLKFNPGSISLRKGLVVFQFCLTIVLIFCTLVVYRQIKFIKSKNLGFDRENLVLVNLEGDLNKKMETFVNEATRLPGIKSATVSTTSPLQAGNSTTAVEWPGKLPDKKILFTQMSVGYDYIKTMGIDLKEGRDFTRDFASDSNAYVINEETVKKMRLENPVGQTITFWGRPGKIVGVVKDYHLNSLHNQIEPVILHLHPQWSNLMMARTEPGKTTQALEGLKSLTAQLNPLYPFEYHFVDETFEKQYRSETTVGTLANYFTVLAIFISCLGLMGLIVFTSEQRTKEIGVRKVLGASVRNILFLLSKDFMVLVIIAFIISTPLAWYLMSHWLNNYAYRVDIGWWVFVASGSASIVIAFLTVSLQGLRAALANPVESLRSE